MNILAIHFGGIQISRDLDYVFEGWRYLGVIRPGIALEVKQGNPIITRTFVELNSSFEFDSFFFFFLLLLSSWILGFARIRNPFAVLSHELLSRIIIVDGSLTYRWWISSGERIFTSILLHHQRNQGGGEFPWTERR